VALSEIDRNLLERCLERKPRAWEDFVDRFMGLVVHVIHHTAQARSIRVGAEDRDDLCAEVFLNFIKDDFGVLRHFRGESSLATYLTVVARRIVVKSLLHRKPTTPLGDGNAQQASHNAADSGADVEQRISSREEVERLLGALDGGEAAIVRMYHLEGKSYQEIACDIDCETKVVDNALCRIKQKIRKECALTA